MSRQKLQVRPAVPSDHPLIYSTYLRNRWFARDNDTTLKKDLWMRAQHARLEKILSTQPVLVACDPTEPDVIYGYRFQDGSRDWTYVKLAFRAHGVAERLKQESLPRVGEEK